MMSKGGLSLREVAEVLAPNKYFSGILVDEAGVVKHQKNLISNSFTLVTGQPTP
jgi:hypothetical protein